MTLFLFLLCLWMWFGGAIYFMTIMINTSKYPMPGNPFVNAIVVLFWPISFPIITILDLFVTRKDR